MAMAREIVVMGAGMVGVSVAWHLARRGHSVILVDRREPGRETSFGNAGIIQREAVRPYPFPRDLGTLMRVLPNREVDIRYRPGGMVGAASPLFQYWINSRKSRYAKIVPEYASLIMRCLETHATMIEASGAESLVNKKGWLEVYRTKRKMDDRLRDIEAYAELYGVEYTILGPKEVAESEPHLNCNAVGAIHWTQPWTVLDPGDLVLAYAESFKDQGGRVFQAEVQEVSRHDKKWRLSTGSGELDADDLVIAMGPWSSKILQELDISLPMFVKRGYHMHYEESDVSLQNWVFDAEVGYFLAPMRRGIRLTTGAELESLDAPPHYEQLMAAESVARKFFPLGKRRDPEPWKGARPCMPDMKPVIGPAPNHDGLWLALGHGHQGFTLGPVTGLLLSQMISGETPEIDMEPFSASRF